MNITPVDFILGGLTMDVAGIVLLAFFGFPVTYLEGKVMSWGFRPKDKIVQRSFSWLGVILVLIGFTLQFVGHCLY